MLSGTMVSKDLDDKSFLMDSAFNILAAQVAVTLTQNEKIETQIYEGLVPKGQNVINVRFVVCLFFVLYLFCFLFLHFFFYFHFFL